MGQRNEDDPEVIKSLKSVNAHLKNQIDETEKQIQDQQGINYNVELQVEKNLKQADKYSHLDPS
jgi:hypothetical protein